MPIARATSTIPRDAPIAPATPVLPGRDVGRPIRVGVITNPQSGRNRRGKGLRAALACRRDHPEVRQHEADCPKDIAEAARSLLREGVEVLAINGGDGTAQAALTGLLNECEPESLPLIAVLPGGTTNTTAGDVGTREHPARALPRLLAAARSGKLDGALERRPVMRVDFLPGAEPMFAMVFGAGAVYHGIKFCHERIYTRGIRGQIAPGLTVAVACWNAALRRGEAVFPPLHVSATVDGKALAPGSQFAVVASTLRHLFLNIHPFWDTGPGALQYSAFSYTPRHVGRAAWELVRRRPDRYLRPENGYVSHNADEVVLRLDSGFTLDGELYLPRPGTPIVLRTGYSAPFLRPPAP